MASPAAPSPQDLSDPPGPSPLPSGVPPREIVDEGCIRDQSPPSDVPDVEETEPPTVLDNPLTADIRSPEPEPEEIKEDSDDRVTTTTVSEVPGHVTECATDY